MWTGCYFPKLNEVWTQKMFRQFALCRPCLCAVRVWTLMFRQFVLCHHSLCETTALVKIAEHCCGGANSGVQQWNGSSRGCVCHLRGGGFPHQQRRHDHDSCRPSAFSLAAYKLCTCTQPVYHWLAIRVWATKHRGSLYTRFCLLFLVFLTEHWSVKK